jgi:ABC-type transport system involved in cytochrome c biogenesis permease subunit
MNYFVDILTVLLPVLYALAVTNSIVHFITQSDFTRKADRPLLATTVGAHALLLVLTSIELRRCPMGGIFEAMGLMAFALTTVYFVISLRTGTRPTGILVLPIAFLLELFSAAAEPANVGPLDGPVNEALRSLWFNVHVFAAVLGFSALAVSFVHGVFYLYLYRQIKAHRFGLFFRRLPPLAALKQMTETGAVVGWGLLAVMIGAGVARAMEEGRLEDLHSDPMILVVGGAFALYTVGLAVRHLAGWRGRYTVLLSVFAFAVLMLSLVFVSSLHGFH